MKKCSRCGTELPHDAAYCYSCGSRVGRRRGLITKLSPFLVATVLAVALLTISGSLAPHGSNPVLERVRAAGFNASIETGGYVVIDVNNAWSALDFTLLENVLRDVDARWVVLKNSATYGDVSKAHAMAVVASGLDNVLGVYVDDGLMVVTVKKPSAELLHTLFKLAGEDAGLVVRFST